MQSMLNSIDGGAAAAATLLLEGELAARELLQTIVDKISGSRPQHCDVSPVLVQQRFVHTHAYRQILPQRQHIAFQINSRRRGQTLACA
jgi:hypothetical protein